MNYFVKFLPGAVLIGILYLLGPLPPKPKLTAKLPLITGNLSELETRVIRKEASTNNLRPDNEARIVWADPVLKQKTKYSLVYLHGFSASQEEGNPIHREFAKRYGYNLYLPRLEGHGVAEEDALINLTPEGLVQSAKEAVAIGKKLGEKVILMSTSTGGTLSLYLASENLDIAGLILYSPNIDLYDPYSSLLSKRWGLEVARTVKDSYYMTYPSDENTDPYWTKKYRLEALVTLRSLIDATMTEEVFQKVKQPVFLGYYYKNEKEQDNVVSVPAMEDMFEQLGTSEPSKRKIAFSKVGDHCIANRFRSKDIEEVKRETFRFAEEVLHLQPYILNGLAENNLKY